MVAIVYEKAYGSRQEHKVLLELRDDFSKCKVSDFYQGETTYEDEIIIGNELKDHIVLRGKVIHKVVKSVMKNVSRETKKDMIQHLKYLLEAESETT